MLLAVAITYGVRAARPEAVKYLPGFADMPMQLDGFAGTDQPKDDSLKEFLEADDIRGIRYDRGDDAAAVSLIYGLSWRTVHTPKACFPTQGWSVIWEEPVQVPVEGELPHEGPVLGELMRVEREGDAMLVLFVFAHKGGTSADYTKHSLAVMTGPKGAGGLSIMMTSPIGRKGEDHTRQVLMELMGALYPHAVSFWYRDKS